MDINLKHRFEKNSSMSFSERSSDFSKFDIEEKQQNPFWLHLSLLLKKNWFIQKRSIRLSLLQLLAPLFACLFIYWLQSVADNLAVGSEVNPEILSIQKIPRCFYNGPDPTNCTTVTYSIIVSIVQNNLDDSVSRATMKHGCMKL